MPNHVINEIVLHGVTLEAASPKILNAKGEVDFGVLLPLPLNFWPGSAGSQHEKAFPGTHLDAATKQWGTKWGAYGDPTAVERDGDTVITFQTAWSHPRGWTCALFNTFNCAITASWLSEGGWAGHIETYAVDTGLIGGPEWTDREIEDGSPEHRRLHKLLWGVEAFEPEPEDDGEGNEPEGGAA